MDTSVTEQELIYIMLLNEEGCVFFFFFFFKFSASNPPIGDAAHLVICNREAFGHIGIVEFFSNFHGLNADLAPANPGVQRRVAGAVGAKLQKKGIFTLLSKEAKRFFF